WGKRAEKAGVITPSNSIIDMARVLAFPRGLLRIKAINLFEMRHGGIQTLAVNEQMAVVTDLDLFTAHCHHAFDVELVLPQALNPFGFKHNDLATFGGPEIVCNPVHEQVVSSHYLQFHNVFTLAKRLA